MCDNDCDECDDVQTKRIPGEHNYLVTEKPLANYVILNPSQFKETEFDHEIPQVVGFFENNKIRKLTEEEANAAKAKEWIVRNNAIEEKKVDTPLNKMCDKNIYDDDYDDIETKLIPGEYNYLLTQKPLANYVILNPSEAGGCDQEIPQVVGFYENNKIRKLTEQEADAARLKHWIIRSNATEEKKLDTTSEKKDNIKLNKESCCKRENINNQEKINTTNHLLQEKVGSQYLQGKGIETANGPVGDWIYYDNHSIRFLVSYGENGRINQVHDFTGLNPKILYDAKAKK